MRHDRTAARPWVRTTGSDPTTPGRTPAGAHIGLRVFFVRYLRRQTAQKRKRISYERRPSVRAHGRVTITDARSGVGARRVRRGRLPRRVSAASGDARWTRGARAPPASRSERAAGTRGRNVPWRPPVKRPKRAGPCAPPLGAGYNGRIVPRGPALSLRTGRGRDPRRHTLCSISSCICAPLRKLPLASPSVIILPQSAMRCLCDGHKFNACMRHVCASTVV